MMSLVRCCKSCILVLQCDPMFEGCSDEQAAKWIAGPVGEILPKHDCVDPVGCECRAPCHVLPSHLSCRFCKSTLTGQEEILDGVCYICAAQFQDLVRVN